MRPEQLDFVWLILKENVSLKVVKEATCVQCVPLWCLLQPHALKFYYSEGIGLCWKMYNYEQQSLPTPSYRIKPDRSEINEVVANLMNTCGAL